MSPPCSGRLRPAGDHRNGIGCLATPHVGATIDRRDGTHVLRAATGRRRVAEDADIETNSRVSGRSNDREVQDSSCAGIARMARRPLGGAARSTRIGPVSRFDRRGFLQKIGAGIALAPFAGMAMTHGSPSTAGPAPERQAPASDRSDSPAISIARAHIEAWSNHDFASARKSLAADIHFTATSMQPAMAPTDLVGIDNYMTGLVRFAHAVVPASARVIASIGDERNALVMVTVKAFLGLGTPKTLPMARLYLLDGQGKIKGEQVIFYVERS